jgi:hypothetical protein
MANEIRTLLNSVAGVKADWIQDWKEDSNGKWIDDWAQDIFTVGTPNKTGTGNGTMTAVSVNSRTAVVETWTFTATNATNFTVSGSVSGAKAALTVGTPYNNGIILATVTAGGTPFVAADAFTVAITDAAPANTVLPVISDTTPQIGNNLTVGTGTWTGAATITYTYQWYKGTAKIAGATTNAYTVLAGDLGSTLKCRVRAANTRGTAYVDTAATTAVAA